MKFLHKATDGGPDSNVTGYWLIESKKYFSIALLKFAPGSREAFHSHAFNAWSWILKGQLWESIPYGISHGYPAMTANYPLNPSWKPVFTGRDRLHRVRSVGTTWAITFRGPWKESWKEYFSNTRKWVTLTEGRQIKEEVYE